MSSTKCGHAVVLVVQYVGNLAWHQEEYRHDNNFPLTTADGGAGPKGGSVTTYGGQRLWPDLVTCQLRDAGRRPTIKVVTETIRAMAMSQPWKPIPMAATTVCRRVVRVQNRWGLSGELDYTWSHEIDIQNAGQQRAA